MEITIKGNSSENKKAIEILQEISKYSDIKINIDIKDKEFIMENGSDRIFYEILDIKNINGTNKYHCIEIFSKAESNINFDQSIHRIIAKDELVKELEDIKKEYIEFDCTDRDVCLEAVKKNGFALQYVKNQTPDICLEAVKQNGLALRYVKEQTPEICLEAVKEDGEALQFVKNQTPDICLAAVKQTGYALAYVKEQTPEICIEAVKQTVYALKYVNNIKDIIYNL